MVRSRSCATPVGKDSAETMIWHIRLRTKGLKLSVATMIEFSERVQRRQKSGVGGQLRDFVLPDDRLLICGHKIYLDEDYHTI